MAVPRVTLGGGGLGHAGARTRWQVGWWLTGCPAAACFGRVCSDVPEAEQVEPSAVGPLDEFLPRPAKRRRLPKSEDHVRRPACLLPHRGA